MKLIFNLCSILVIITALFKSSCGGPISSIKTIETRYLEELGMLVQFRHALKEAALKKCAQIDRTESSQMSDISDRTNFHLSDDEIISHSSWMDDESMEAGSDTTRDLNHGTESDMNRILMTNELPRPENQMITEMPDYDPMKTKWIVQRNQNEIEINSYEEAYEFVQNTKLAVKFSEWKNLIPTLVDIQYQDSSYLHPSGGITLKPPYQHGVQFSDTELMWESFLPYGNDEQFTFGFFSNSRAAAAAYNQFVERNRRCRYVDVDYPLNDAIDPRHLSRQDKQEIQLSSDFLDTLFPGYNE